MFTGVAKVGLNSFTKSHCQVLQSDKISLLTSDKLLTMTSKAIKSKFVPNFFVLNDRFPTYRCSRLKWTNIDGKLMHYEDFTSKKFKNSKLFRTSNFKVGKFQLWYYGLQLFRILKNCPFLSRFYLKYFKVSILKFHFWKLSIFEVFVSTKFKVCWLLI